MPAWVIQKPAAGGSNSGATNSCCLSCGKRLQYLEKNGSIISRDPFLFWYFGARECSEMWIHVDILRDLEGKKSKHTFFTWTPGKMLKPTGRFLGFSPQTANPRYPVLDLVAYRHGSRSLGLPYHCLDGHLAAMLCFDETIVKISKENRFFDDKNVRCFEELCGFIGVCVFVLFCLWCFIMFYICNNTSRNVQVSLLTRWRPRRQTWYIAGVAAVSHQSCCWFYSTYPLLLLCLERFEYHKLIQNVCMIPRPNWPLFLKVNPPKQGPNSNQNKGHLGSRYIIIYIFITCLGATQVVIFSLLCELASIYVKLKNPKNVVVLASLKPSKQTILRMWANEVMDVKRDW